MHIASARTNQRWISTAARLCLAAAACSSCARTVIDAPLSTTTPPGDTLAELDFWDAFGTRPVVCNDEGLHALFIFADGQDATRTYDDRVKAAQQRRWLDDSWAEPANLAMQRGTLARAVAVHCKIEGGVMMRLLGPNPRYASRELQYMGIMGSGTELQTISGPEFMGVLSKVQDYQLLKVAEAEAQTPKPPETHAPPAPAPQTPQPAPAPPRNPNEPSPKRTIP